MLEKNHHRGELKEKEGEREEKKEGRRERGRVRGRGRGREKGRGREIRAENLFGSDGF